MRKYKNIEQSVVFSCRAWPDKCTDWPRFTRNKPFYALFYLSPLFVPCDPPVPCTPPWVCRARQFLYPPNLEPLGSQSYQLCASFFLEAVPVALVPTN